VTNLAVEMEKIETPKALVIGMGKTGLSAIAYLCRQGYDVTVMDSRNSKQVAKELIENCENLQIKTGPFPLTLNEKYYLIVVSPGVPLVEPFLVDARRQGLEIIGDVELFARNAKTDVIAITGSNGKSTVTTLVAEMCRAAHLQIELGGNIGVPVLTLLEKPQPDIYVLELSSFQLEATSSLNARAAVILNVSPDHMDRYDSLEEYSRAKQNIFSGNGVMVLNSDDARVVGLTRADREVIYFGLSVPNHESDFGLMDRNGEQWLLHGERAIIPVSEVRLVGRHNIANALAAMALCSVIGVPYDAMKKVLREFSGLPHRTEVIADRDGVLWVNDSKGTNIGSTIAAVQGIDRNKVVLIAGGEGKGANFNELREPIAAKARAVIVIGRDATLIEDAIRDVVVVFHAESMEDAVIKAGSIARAGDVVLLSPACASFDMYSSFEERGEDFRQAVKDLLASKVKMDD